MSLKNLQQISNPSLLREIIADRTDVQVQVEGTSMLPCLRSGDIAKIVRKDREYRQGDIVVRIIREELVIHRIVWISKGSKPVVFTKGDNSRGLDSSCLESELLGVVRSVERGQRRGELSGGRLEATGRWIARLTAFRFGLSEQHESISPLENVESEEIAPAQASSRGSLVDVVLRGLILSVRSVHGMLLKGRMTSSQVKREAN